MKYLIIFVSLVLIFIGISVVSSENKNADTKEKNNKMTTGENMSNMNYETATFGAGCFWGVEAVFQELDGVKETSVGFMGGTTENPSYKEVCYTDTKHAEVCQVVYDPNVISYTDLLSVFFSLHDPTTLNRQGPDVGDQYRSAIFYHNEDQKERALDALRQIKEKKYYSKEVVTEVTPAQTFYSAEDYHQDYYKNRGITPHCGIGVVNVELEEMAKK